MRERVNFKHGFILTLLVFLFSAVLVIKSPVKAYELPPVLINEIAWMGNDVSTADEWLELRNTTNEEIDLTGWHLRWGSVDIALTGFIPAEGYFLLERTDDDSVPGVTADQIYVGSLSNTGGDLVLVNAVDVVIDSAVFDLWPAGDNNTKQTMERVCPVTEGNLASAWQNSELANGSPQAINFGCEVLVCEALELNRLCQSEGLAEVNYTYANLACGENFSQVEADSSCSCEYSQWEDASCVAAGLREQTREKITDFSYCQAELTRQVEDLACVVATDLVWQAQGRGCFLIENSRECGISTASLDVDNLLNVELAASSGWESVDYLVNQITDQEPVAVYKNTESKLHLVWQKMHDLILIMGKGVWFQGKVE